MSTSRAGLATGDLRRHPRTPIELPVEILEGDSVRVGRSLDLSLGGMFVACEEPAAFGASLTIRVTLPGQRVPFHIPGVVRWVRADGMGVQFGMIGARETFAITELARST